MKTEQLLRAVGVLGCVGLYAIYANSTGDVQLRSLAIVVAGIVALVSPEVLESLPFGPSKNTK